MAKETSKEVDKGDDGAKPLSFERSPDHRTIYSNNMGLAATTSDIQIRIGQTISRADGKGAQQLEVATLIMAPPQAKALLVILAEAISDWERRNGELPLPEHLARKLAAAKPKAE